VRTGEGEKPIPIARNDDQGTSEKPAATTWQSGAGLRESGHTIEAMIGKQQGDGQKGEGAQCGVHRQRGTTTMTQRRGPPALGADVAGCSRRT